MSLMYPILRVLADGRFRSGEALGQILGVSRTAVWKHVQAITKLGLEVQAVPGKGYRLAYPLELLDQKRILAAMGEQQVPLSGMELHHDIASTNASLLGRAAWLPSGYACIAECQRAGRGRRGRDWVSPYASNIYLSLLWRFNQGVSGLGGLGLAMGVAVARALRELGLAGVGLKWPNDVIWEGRKLAGILLELGGESQGPCHVVTGVGLNVRMPPAAALTIDQPWVDLERAVGRSVSRNDVTGCLLRHLRVALQCYEANGLPSFLPEWRQHDVIAGQRVRLNLSTNAVEGVAIGVDEDGALLLHQSGITQRYCAGEVSVRPLFSPMREPT